MTRAALLCSGLLAALAGCSERGADTASSPATGAGETAAVATAPRGVTGARIAAADTEPQNWLSHGRDYGEQRYSPLDRISADNVGKLGLAWAYDLPTNRGVEATPLVAEGVLYTTGSWSIVYALDAATGQEIWVYDPQVPREKGFYACCDVVNRGVALWEDKVYVGALDGRLIAIDAAKGQRVWEMQTTDPAQPYTITGAPRVVDGKVIIGNGGAEFGVRGYVTAYDARTGAQVWRFHTIPGDPALGFENAAMKKAAATWSGQWWTQGGGGTVWDSMAYDPALGLLYIGVGNGAPWNQRYRSPDGGDNLYLSSIVALDAATGEYRWHYQTTPGDHWDFTATQHIVLADVEWQGRTRKVLMQAPKNGFFYVLDRATGELLAADPYVTTTWATHVDMATGRPVETSQARYAEGPQVLSPTPFGGHNWPPMAYSPKTGLVYIPTQDLPFRYNEIPGWTPTAGGYNLGVSFAVAALPPDAKQAGELVAGLHGHITAWDPIARAPRWRVEHPGVFNGGLLATAGNLIFQGTERGEFAAYRADTGDRLWSFDGRSGIFAGPVSYAVGEEQYVTVMAGSGTVYGVAAGQVASFSLPPNASRVLTFRLDGTGTLPPAVVVDKSIPEPPMLIADADALARGKTHYDTYCARCHGDNAVSGGVIPDLRRMAPDTHAAWQRIVHDGERKDLGMLGFAQWLDATAVDEVHQYVISRAREDRAAAAAP